MIIILSSSHTYAKWSMSFDELNFVKSATNGTQQVAVV